jgi:hypothetical protein
MQPIVRVGFHDEVRQQFFRPYDSTGDRRQREHEERAIVEVGIPGGQMIEVVVLPDGQYEIAIYDSADPHRRSTQYIGGGDLEGPPRPR